MLDVSNVFYINLEHRHDRNRECQQELNKLNTPYERFNAIKHEKGYIGCTMSHIKVLEMAIERNLENYAVFEDDIVITQPEYLIREINAFIKSDTQFDVFIICPRLENFVQTKNKNIKKVLTALTTTAYIVNKHYYAKLLDNFKSGLDGLLNNKPRNRYAIDTHWVFLQRKDNWYCLSKRIGKQRAGYSDNSNRYEDYGC